MTVTFEQYNQASADYQTGVNNVNRAIDELMGMRAAIEVMKQRVSRVTDQAKVDERYTVLVYLQNLLERLEREYPDVLAKSETARHEYERLAREIDWDEYNLALNARAAAPESEE